MAATQHSRFSFEDCQKATWSNHSIGRGKGRRAPLPDHWALIMPTDTSTESARDIGSLDDLSLDDLRLRWQALFGRIAPTHLPRYLLFRLCAYRLQSDRWNDLSPSTLQLLERLGRTGSDDKKPVPLPTGLNGKSGLRPGTVLVREHAGILRHVVVSADGFCWDGQTYSSLSQVARAITGTNWNGRRFFGLQRNGALS